MNRRKHDKRPKHRAPTPAKVADPMPVIEEILWPNSWLTADEARGSRNS